jgi:hypothetical protein
MKATSSKEIRQDLAYGKEHMDRSISATGKITQNTEKEPTMIKPNSTTKADGRTI